jgi:hypothetical protein
MAEIQNCRRQNVFEIKLFQALKNFPGIAQKKIINDDSGDAQFDQKKNQGFGCTFCCHLGEIT